MLIIELDIACLVVKLMGVVVRDTDPALLVFTAVTFIEGLLSIVE